VHDVVSILPGNEIELGAKVAFLSRAEAYSPWVNEVIRRETHMSWVFLAGDKVFKLKKPVRFPYLDFSTLAKREAACRAELRLNRRLAPDVYLDVAPLKLSCRGFSVGGEKGLVVDWLVVMRRLDERAMLEHAIAAGRTAGWQLDQLADALVHFYRQAVPAIVTPERQLAYWWQSLSYNRRVLLDARSGLPAGLVSRVDQALRRFLAHRSHILTARVRERHVIDGHGDLRPEHIWLGDPVRIIDCLEFNDRLRTVDPFDEIAFLDLECERLGAAWIGRYLRRKVARGLSDGIACGSPSPTPCASIGLSEHKEIGERASLVQPADCFCEQRRRRQDGQLVAWHIAVKPKRRNRVSNDEPFDRRIGKDFGRARHEQTVRDERDNSLCSGFASGASGTQECATCADQVVDHESCRARHIAHEQIARNDASATVLVHKSLANRPSVRGFECLAEQLGPLGTAGVRRDNAEMIVGQ
jgi:uncharacterized protein